MATPPQTSIPLPATILGLIGTICWCIQLVPQIVHSYRTKNTEGLPPAMMFLWSASGLPFGVYVISQRFNIPIIVQPQFFCIFCGISWAQCLLYGRKWPRIKAIAACIGVLLFFAILEVILVLVIRGPYSKGLSWPVELMGIVACIMLLGGYLPVCFEIIKRRGRVIGVSFVFLAIDCSGAIFSLLSLVTQRTFDPLFGSLYSICAALELSFFVSHGVWLLRTRRLRKRAREQNLSYDNFPEAVEWQARGLQSRVTGNIQNFIQGDRNSRREEGFLGPT